MELECSWGVSCVLFDWSQSLFDVVVPVGFRSCNFAFVVNAATAAVFAYVIMAATLKEVCFIDYETVADIHCRAALLMNLHR